MENMAPAVAAVAVAVAAVQESSSLEKRVVEQLSLSLKLAVVAAMLMLAMVSFVGAIAAQQHLDKAFGSVSLLFL